MLFSDRSLLTMLHGIVFGGGAMMALVAALFAIGLLLRPVRGPSFLAADASRALAGLTVVIALLMWLAVLSGTYLVFPPYRATPPAGATELAAYPRALLLSEPGNRWLHAFAMEIKEHMPWLAAMLSTAVAYATVRHPRVVLGDETVRRFTLALLAICFALASVAALLGTFVNKVAPLE
jgi:hypothetical protein